MSMLIRSRPVRQLRQMLQDPILALALVLVSLFVFIAIILPILGMVGTAFSPESLPLFDKYLAQPNYQTIISNTVVLGLTVGLLGTVVGFLFAYVQVKVKAPALVKRVMHLIALVPIISPPFALASAAILMFGRNGMITKGIFGVPLLLGAGAHLQ